MSRSGYSDDLDVLALGRWRAQVKSATNGKRGQAFFVELLAALDAMPDKRLISSRLKDDAGCMCTLGVIGDKRGIDLKELENKALDKNYSWLPMDHEVLGDAFGVAKQLAAEVMHMNDEGCWRSEEPEQKWDRMRRWVAEQIKPLSGTPQPYPEMP